MPQQILSFDSQILNSIQSCARKTQYSFIENLKPPVKASPLEKGSLMHQMLEIYYGIKGKCIADNADWIEELCSIGLLSLNGALPSVLNSMDWEHDRIVKLCVDAGQYYSTKISLPTEVSESIIYQFKEYTSFYQHDSWHPLAVEEVGSKVMYEDDDLKLIYNFKIDLVAEKGSIIAPWDHKTSSRREEPSSMSNQFIGYCYGLNMNYIVINKIGFQKTLKPSERFQRFSLPISNARIEEWIENTIKWGKVLHQALRSNDWSMDLTSCDKYGGCIYLPICESDPSLRDRKKRQDFIVGDQWDVAKLLEGAK